MNEAQDSRGIQQVVCLIGVEITDFQKRSIDTVNVISAPLYSGIRVLDDLSPMS